MKEITPIQSLLFFVLFICGLTPGYLLAQPNIEVSSPSNYITKLQDIHVDLDGFGFAAGDCGVLLHTSTDGQFWEPVEAPTEENIASVACAPDGCSTAIIAAQDGLYRYSDGSWSTIDSENAGYGGTLHWLTDEILIHETSGDFYFRSGDGGLTWEEFELTSFQQGNMSFIDSNTGFMWLDKGLYKTTNAGGTFEFVGYTHSANINNQTWLDDQKGWIFSSDRLFYATTDGGQNWSLLNDEQQLNSVNWMVALSETHLVGAQVTTFRIESLDGGVTWTRGNFIDGGNERVNSRYHRRGNAFFTVGDANQIMYSPGGFTDFEEQDPIERHKRVSRIVFHSSDVGYAADASLLLKTTDGVNWSYLDRSFSFIEDLAILPDGSLVVLNSSRTIISADQGETFTDWVPEGTVPDGGYGSKFSEKPNGDYYLLGSEYASLSDDGGETWVGINHGSNISFHGIQWITDDIGYAYSRQGRFAKTNDGGLSWSESETEISNLEGMYFIDEMNGWLSTASRRYETTDGGQNWEIASEGGGYDFQKYPDDGSILVASYLSGNNGAISRSIDEGQTWQRLNFNCFAYRAGALTPDGNYYWTGGDGFLVRHDLKALIEQSTNTKDYKSSYSSLLVYPNPTEGHFTIELPQSSEAGSLKVFEIGGRQIRELQLAPGVELQNIDISSLSPGIYIVRWLSGNQIGHVKLMKR